MSFWRLVRWAKTQNSRDANKKTSRKNLRNDVEAFHWTNSHNLKHEYKQDDYAAEHERRERIQSRVARTTHAQSAQERNIWLNNDLNEQLYKRQKHHVNHCRRLDVHEQSKRWHLTKVVDIFFFIFFITQTFSNHWNDHDTKSSLSSLWTTSTFWFTKRASRTVAKH
jgi:ribosomal protein L31E